MTEITAALGHERYNWHTFQGKRGVTLHHKGQPHTKLQAGMRYGMRHSNDGKSIHLITEHNGKNIVHKISHDHSERLADRSKPLRAGTKIKDPHNHTEVKPKKPAAEEHPAPAGKPKKRGRNRTSVHEAIEKHRKDTAGPVPKHHREAGITTTNSKGPSIGVHRQGGIDASPLEVQHAVGKHVKNIGKSSDGKASHEWNLTVHHKGETHKVSIWKMKGRDDHSYHGSHRIMKKLFPDHSLHN